MESRWIDYGPDWPPPPEKLQKPRRRRWHQWPGFGLDTNIAILVGTVVTCAVILKLADRRMQLNLKSTRSSNNGACVEIAVIGEER